MSSGVNAPIREQTLDHHAPRLHRRPVADRAWPACRVLSAAPDRRRDGAERVRGRQAAIAAGHGARSRHRSGDDHRICVDDLRALRALQRNRVPEDQVGIHRQRQDPLRVPRIPARHQGRSGLDAGALHRQGRCRQVFRRHRHAVQAAERLGREEHHRDPDADRQAGRDEPAGHRGLPEGSGAARQDRRRPEVRQRGVEGQFDADLFHQWRDGQGCDLVRGIRQEDQGAAEELNSIISACRPGERRDPYRVISRFGVVVTACFTTDVRDYGSLRSQGRRRGKPLYPLQIPLQIALQIPWEKPGAAVALRPRPRHCRGA